MLQHAEDTTQRGATSIISQSPDTDVLVLALWICRRLCPGTRVIAGTGRKSRSIPLGPFYEAVGEDLVKALPGFCAFPNVIRQALSVEKAKSLVAIH